MSFDSVRLMLILLLRARLRRIRFRRSANWALRAWAPTLEKLAK